MTRLAKLFKLLKSKNTVVMQFSNKLKIDHGSERLVFLGFFMTLFLHISSCGYVILSQFIEAARKDGISTRDNPATWLIKYGDYHLGEDGDLVLHKSTYIKALYFTTTTVSTVGYGDITAQNSYEMIWCIILQCIGVVIFTFISGALSSILANYDAREA